MAVDDEEGGRGLSISEVTDKPSLPTQLHAAHAGLRLRGSDSVSAEKTEFTTAVGKSPWRMAYVLLRAQVSLIPRRQSEELQSALGSHI